MRMSHTKLFGNNYFYSPRRLAHPSDKLYPLRTQLQPQDQRERESGQTYDRLNDSLTSGTPKKKKKNNNNNNNWNMFVWSGNF
jgi:hypothetical protein